MRAGARRRAAEREAQHRAWMDNPPPHGPESYAEYVARWKRIRERAMAELKADLEAQLGER